MSKHLIVIENKNDWKAGFPGYDVITARDYLSQPEYGEKGMRVINLCRSYGYLSTGYYCSLLAQARRHRIVPEVRTLSDLSRKALYSLDAENLDDTLSKPLKDITATTFELYIYFGRCETANLQDLARQLFELFPAPLLRVDFKRDTPANGTTNTRSKWHISRIRPAYLNQLNDDQRTQFIHAMEAYLDKPWRNKRNRNAPRYDLAILIDPDDPLPPSNRRALKHFERIGKSLSINVDIITKKDYPRLAEYDALFIRDTTRIDHYTYRFAKKAQSENMVVIDDPDSILKCTNKVYLAELLRAHKIPHPKTVVLQENQLDGLTEEIAFPVVLKIPDGAFSRGVFKAHNREELKLIANKLFKESELILAQEYVYTEYDWRIGILNRRAIYACQYFMSRNHWQIVNHKEGGRFVEGGFRSMAVEAAPPKVVKIALKAANLIGDGLYGVDLKQNEAGVFVIEVNDNPNLESGVEDGFLKDSLYRIILTEFIDRLERKRYAS
ncbi:MAG TPA: RimK family protein [Gammaproteobacteria bacterium]|nr:RimK family protein [Gammaproteobacteria bacterium]